MCSTLVWKTVIFPQVGFVTHYTTYLKQKQLSYSYHLDLKLAAQ